MRKVCDLCINEAIDAIKDESVVQMRRGVWNEYSAVSAESVIKSINNSGYGADVRVDDNGMYYVSIPNDSDMW